MNYGCWFTSLNFNMPCYADDIALTAPSAYGSRQLIDRLCYLLTILCLKPINKNFLIMFSKSIEILPRFLKFIFSAQR